MPDREKVIDHLLIIRTWNEVGKAYAHDEMDKKEKTKTVEWIDDALTMLKEQKAEAKWIYREDKTGVDGWHCSECGFFEPWFYEFTDDIDFIRFYGLCPSCGRKMTSYTGKPTQVRQ